METELHPGAWTQRQQLESCPHFWRVARGWGSQKWGKLKWPVVTLGQGWEAQWFRGNVWVLRVPSWGKAWWAWSPSSSLHCHLALSYTCAGIGSANVIRRQVWDWWVTICQGKAHRSCVLAGCYIIKCSLCSYGEYIYFFEWASGSTKAIIPWKRFRHDKLQVWKTPLKGHLSLWFVAC